MTNPDPPSNPRWTRYIRFWGRRVSQELDAELRFHLEMRVKDYMATGMDESAARAAAAHRLGNTDMVKQECVIIGRRSERHMARRQWIAAAKQDLAFSIRALRRQPGWTAVSVLTMALGIGAGTAMFSIVNSVLLHPLPYRASDRVVLLWQTDKARDVLTSPSPQLVDAWRRRSTSLEGIEQYATIEATLTTRQSTEIIHTVAIRPTFLDFAGVQLLAGRGFTSDELLASGAHVVVLGEGIWRQAFGADPGVVGRTVTIDAKLYTVIGVAPASLRVPSAIQSSTDAWVPLTPEVLEANIPEVVARLRPNIRTESAERELNVIAQSSGIKLRSGGRAAPSVALMRPSETVRVRSSLLLLASGVALLLVIACANVAHLQIARGMARRRELVIRAALGAGRGRLFRLALTESAVIAASGCLMGIAFALAGLRIFLGILPTSLGELSRTRVDSNLLVVAVLCSAASGLVFGLVSAMQAARSDATGSLRSVHSSVMASPRARRFRSAIVVSETALSAMLLILAVLLIRTMVHLQNIDPGFDTRDLYSVSVSRLRPPRYVNAVAAANFGRELAERTAKIPGVVALTVAATGPTASTLLIGRLEIEGRPVAADQAGFMSANYVRPDYFKTVGIQLVSGRGFGNASARDNEIVINAGMARRNWPNASPIGTRIRFPFPSSNPSAPQRPWLTIVGVAANTPTRGLTSDMSAPLVYLPSFSGTGEDVDGLVATIGNRGVTVIVRAEPGFNPTAAIRKVVGSIDPYLGIPVASSVVSQLDKTVASERFLMFALTIFAGIAILLSAVGLYGFLSFTVSQRTREIGVRVALGASPSRAAVAVISGAVLLAAGGLTIGMVGAIWGTRLIKTSLFGVGPNDALSYVICAVILLAIAILASVLPARRASNVDPLIAMRAE